MAYGMISNMANIRIKLDKTDILDALEKYKADHKTEYQDALDVYREDVKKELDKLALKAAVDFKIFDVQHNLGLTAPVNCDKEYGQLITLFTASYDDILELDMGEANRILNNEWEWAQSANTTNFSYSSRKVR